MAVVVVVMRNDGDMTVRVAGAAVRVGSGGPWWWDAWKVRGRTLRFSFPSISLSFAFLINSLTP